MSTWRGKEIGMGENLPHILIAHNGYLWAFLEHSHVGNERQYVTKMYFHSQRAFSMKYLWY